MKKNSVIIAGPTASGKSDFAHELAKRINGAVINCDSVQIYRDIETISASPFAENTKNGFDEIKIAAKSLVNAYLSTTFPNKTSSKGDVLYYNQNSLNTLSNICKKLPTKASYFTLGV